MALSAEGIRNKWPSLDAWSPQGAFVHSTLLNCTWESCQRKSIAQNWYTRAPIFGGVHATKATLYIRRGFTAARLWMLFYTYVLSQKQHRVNNVGWSGFMVAGSVWALWGQPPSWLMGPKTLKENDPFKMAHKWVPSYSQKGKERSFS